MFIVDVSDEVVHVAHVLLASFPATHGHLFAVLVIFAWSSRNRAGGVGGDVGNGDGFRGVWCFFGGVVVDCALAFKSDGGGSFDGEDGFGGRGRRSGEAG